MGHTSVIYVKPTTGKTQIQKIIERRQHLCLADKLHLMADSLRNFNGTQCKGKFYIKESNSFCAYGVLGYLSGIPKDELVVDNFTKVLKNYGIDLAESSISVNFPREAKGMYMEYPDRKVSLFQAIFLMNDRGFTFPEIADHLDQWANNLQS